MKQNPDDWSGTAQQTPVNGGDADSRRLRTPAEAGAYSPRAAGFSEGGAQAPASAGVTLRRSCLSPPFTGVRSETLTLMAPPVLHSAEVLRPMKSQCPSTDKRGAGSCGQSGQPLDDGLGPPG